MADFVAFSEEAFRQLQDDLTLLHGKVRYLEHNIEQHEPVVVQTTHFPAIVTEEITAKDGDEVGSGKAKIQYRNTGNDELELWGVEYEIRNASSNTYAVDDQIQVIRSTADWWTVPAGSVAEGFAWEHNTSSSDPDAPAYGILRSNATSGGGTGADPFVDSPVVIKLLPVDWEDKVTTRYQESSLLFVNSGSVVEANASGRAFTGNDKPVRIRIAEGTNTDANRDVGRLWGPIYSPSTSWPPSDKRDERAVYPGLPGFRLLGFGGSIPWHRFEEVDYTDPEAVQTSYSGMFMRDEHAPFLVVADENWTFNETGINDNEPGQHYVNCYVVEHIPHSYDGIRNADFQDAHPELIYDGHDTLHPKCPVRVVLPTNGRTHHPNIERGQVFEVRTVAASSENGPNATNESANEEFTDSDVRPVGDWWLDRTIWSVEEMTDIIASDDSGNEPAKGQGWGLMDGTENDGSSVRGAGSGIDMTTNTYATGAVLTSRSSAVDGDPLGVNGDNTTEDIRFVRVHYYERLDNSENNGV